MNEKVILAQIPAARVRARRARASVPHARWVKIDGRPAQLHVELTNGGAFSIPVALIPELRAASSAELRQARVDAAGIGIHWPSLDIDLSVAGLAEVVLGRSTLLRAAGAAGGSAKSKAKADAARKNGSKGGRPRKEA